MLAKKTLQQALWQRDRCVTYNGYTCYALVDKLKGLPALWNDIISREEGPQDVTEWHIKSGVYIFDYDTAIWSETYISVNVVLEPNTKPNYLVLTPNKLSYQKLIDEVVNKSLTTLPELASVMLGLLQPAVPTNATIRVTTSHPYQDESSVATGKGAYVPEAKPDDEMCRKAAKEPYEKYANKKEKKA